MEKIARAVSLILALALAGCAGQFPPSGGPIDTTPPKIVRSSPTPDQINFTSNEIRIKWDKYMVERTVEGSVYFPPFDLKDLKFDWSGSEVEIRIGKPLEKDRTYILTIGARAQDTRGNFLGKAESIVFSTGAQIDTGEITGDVYSAKAQPYAVAAYPVNPEIDTLNPSNTLPRYVTESDDSGRYVLQGLAKDKYRLICFDDQMRNYLYAPQFDHYASATHDVDVTEESQAVKNVNFIVGIEDTSRPQLYSANLANDGLLLLKFSEPLDTSDIQPSYFVVRDSASGKTFPVDFAARLESNEYNAVIRTASPLPLRRKYFVIATDSLMDTHKNRMSTTNNKVVMEPDSASVRIAPYFFNFADSLKGVTPYDTLFCQFVIPTMNRVLTSPEVSLLDSTGKALAGSVVRESPTMFAIDLHEVHSAEWYRVKLNYKSDINGIQKDSVVIRRFLTVDSMQIGDLQGNVTPVVPGRKIIVAAERQGGKIFYAYADSNGDYKLDGILSGTYTVRAYLQHGEGMGYFSGKSYPFEFAEPFGVYENPVKVRARWTTDGVVIKMR